MSEHRSVTHELDDWLEKADDRQVNLFGSRKPPKPKAPKVEQMSMFADLKTGDAGHRAQTSMFPAGGRASKPKAPAGYQPVRGSKKGGYFKMQGGKRVYWYPDKGHSQVSAEPHLEKPPTERVAGQGPAPGTGPDRPASANEVETDARYTLFSKHPSSGRWMQERSYYGAYFRPGSEGAAFFDREHNDKWLVMKQGVEPVSDADKIRNAVERTAANRAAEAVRHARNDEVTMATVRSRQTPMTKQEILEATADSKFRSSRSDVADKLKAMYEQHKESWGTMTKKEKSAFKAKMTRLNKKVDSADTDAQMYMDVLSMRTGHDMGKSGRLVLDLKKGGGQKPPAGFTPIPNSPKGGYHMKQGAGYVYWYPGQGIVSEPHSDDQHNAPATGKPVNHWEKTKDGYQMEHNGKTATISNQGGKFVLSYDGRHFEMPGKAGFQHAEGKLLELAPLKPEGGEEAAPDTDKKQDKSPDKKTGEIAEAPEKTGPDKSESPDKKQDSPPDKQDKPAPKEPKKRAGVITDPAELPGDFNKMDKMERAKMTADYKTVVKEMTERFGEPRKYSGDLKESIGQHIDDMSEQGYIIPGNVAKAKEMLHNMVDHGLAAGVSKARMGKLMEENVRKLAHQEMEAAVRTLGDHGVRHLSVNAKQSDQIFEQLRKGGVDIAPMDNFMAYQVWLDHDMGYTIPAIAKGGFAVKDNYHPQASTVMSEQQQGKMKAIFGEDGYKKYLAAVANHSGSEVDWKGDYFGSAVRLADNTHLFADKMPEVLFDSKDAVEAMVKIRLASEHVPGTGKDGKRTQEEKAKFKAMISGVREQLVKAIGAREDLPPQSKAALTKAAQEIGELTPKFLVGRLAGRNPKFDFDGKDMKVIVEQSNVRNTIGQVFGADDADKQFVKLLEDYGTSPDKALGKKPPPPGARIGNKGNGIEFSWTKPTSEHHTEKSHADTMSQVNEQWRGIAGDETKMDAFFGVNVAKSLAALLISDPMDSWLAKSEQEHPELAALGKSAMSAVAERTGRHRPSAYAPETAKPAGKKPGLGARVRGKLGMKPGGGGWQPVGNKGGYRKMGAGGKYSYWYPGMKEGASQEAADKHLARQEFDHHSKQTAKWQETAAKRHESGQHRDHVESAREKMHHHAAERDKLARKHGFSKSEERTMSDNNEQTIRKARIGIGDCYAELDTDDAIAKALESEDGLQIGVQNKTIGPQLRKGTIYQGEAQDQPSPPEDQQLSHIAATIVESDPAGYMGQGGLGEWWKDAEVGKPTFGGTLVVKSEPGATRVIDDTDPLVRREFTKLDR